MNQDKRGQPLVLIPTQMELDTVSQTLDGADLRLCGFGPIASAANGARLIEELRPSIVIVMGIAGTYDQATLPLGAACAFETVACYGIGFGQGDKFSGPQQMNLAQWASEEKTIFDELTLNASHADSIKSQLLTVCSAATNQEEVTERRRMFPGSVAEDMEGFGVALACHVANMPVGVVRGISNIAGDRNQSNWCIAEALQSAGEVVETMLDFVNHG